MSEKQLIIKLQSYPDIQIRSINKDDLEKLRVWKNNNSSSFFYKDQLTEQQQKQWYDNYLKRDDDHMFIFEEKINNKMESLGCLGFREKEGQIDVYNIIRGRKMMGSIGQMRDAMYMMCNYIQNTYRNIEITCKVLVTNPAKVWYEKLGFKIIKCNDNYYDLKLDWVVFQKCPITIKSYDL